MSVLQQGDRHAIAAGLTVANIASSFISPLRQAPERPIVITPHAQPFVAESMVKSLRGLPLRDHVESVGIDAYCAFVVDLDNQGHVSLWTKPPASQAGEADDYDGFIARIAAQYAERVADLERLPEAAGLSVAEALQRIAAKSLGALNQLSDAALVAGIPGADEIAAILPAIEVEVNGPEPE